MTREEPTRFAGTGNGWHPNALHDGDHSYGPGNPDHDWRQYLADHHGGDPAGASGMDHRGSRAVAMAWATK